MELSNKFRWAFTLIAILLAALHIIFPGLSIDAITLGLFIIAFLPLYLHLSKRLELPGGITLGVKDVNEITVKLMGKSSDLSDAPETFKSIKALNAVAEHEPNLALVG